LAELPRTAAQEALHADWAAVLENLQVGLARFVALYYRPSTLYRIH
jgi:hypothetical protein